MASTLAASVACWPAPTQSVTPGRALFAKGLAKGCTSAHLQAIFSTFGTVTDCQIARHRSGRSAGFAIVTFLRHEEAVAAMQAVDNLMFMGRRLSVKWFSPERALEGSSHGVDVLNMQALQQALQLSQMQPADLMAQLAQMLESPRLAPQEQQNPHVAAWLDNFVLAQQRDSPLAQPIHDAAQQQSPMDLLNLSALSLTDMSGQALGVPPAPGLGTHPATPSSMDVPDGAVFVTAGTNIGGNKGGNLVIAHSRLSKWCTAPGSAGGRSSAGQSLADDTISETASVHASDDSSIATTTVQIMHVSCDGPSCGTEGSSPSAAPGMPEAPGAAAARPAAANANANAAACSVAASAPLAPVSEGDEAMRNRAFGGAGAAASTRPSVMSSDPGTMQQAKRPSVHCFSATPPILPGAPALAPLRTVATAPPMSMQHMPRSAPQQARPSMPNFNSCGGGASATPDACLQQALRLQQALAEQARTMTAQQQYVDALAKLAAARDQVMAAATLLNSNGAMSAASLQMPPAMAPHHQNHHHHHHPMGPPPTATVNALMGHMSAPVNHFMSQQPQAQGPVPDINTFLMLQNRAMGY